MIISYGCVGNIEQIIKQRNDKIVNSDRKIMEKDGRACRDNHN